MCRTLSKCSLTLTDLKCVFKSGNHSLKLSESVEVCLEFVNTSYLASIFYAYRWWCVIAGQLARGLVLRPRHCTFTQPDFHNTKHTMVGQKHHFTTFILSSKLGKAIATVWKSCHFSREWYWWVRNSVAIWITAVGDRRTKPCFRSELPPQSAAEIEFKSLLRDATRHMPQIIPSRLQTELKCRLFGWMEKKRGLTNFLPIKKRVETARG